MEPAVRKGPGRPRKNPAAPKQVTVVESTPVPVPETELTPEQLRIRQLEDQLARSQAAALDKAPEEVESTPVEEEIPEGAILIHVASEAFSAWGTTFYRGQELLIPLDSKAYEFTKDRFGKTWLTWDESTQLERWKIVNFRVGPWTGLGYSDPAAAAKAAKAGRITPIPPRI